MTNNLKKKFYPKDMYKNESFYPKMETVNFCTWNAFSLDYK